MLSSRPVEISMNPNLQYAKTPGRVKNRGENAVRAPMTGAKMRGKEAALQTPHAAQLAGKLLSMTARGKPLGDKTPFPNRLRNQNLETPGMGKISKPTFELVKIAKPDAQGEPTPVRPSSLRKNIRSPNAGNFKTPANKGNHWESGEVSFTTEEPEVQAVPPQEDYDEIEYMAPNTLDLPYTPPFDFELPDFKELGKTLFSLAHSRPYPDSPPPEVEINEEDLPTSWDILELPALESDDPFRFREAPPPAPAATAAKPTLQAKPRVASSAASRPAQTRSASATQKPSTTTRGATGGATTSRGTTRTAPRIAASRSATTSRSATATRLAAIPARPATAAAVRPPTTSRAAAGAAINRPTTSAANYKSEVPATRRPVETKTSMTSGIRKSAPARKADAVVVNCGALDLDDFQFDV